MGNIAIVKLSSFWPFAIKFWYISVVQDNTFINKQIYDQIVRKQLVIFYNSDCQILITWNWTKCKYNIECYQSSNNFCKIDLFVNSQNVK